LNKSIETHFQGLVKVAKDNCLSPNEQVEMYKFILEYITSQIEKYLGEMQKL
jgi:hypothetical protein